MNWTPSSCLKNLGGFLFFQDIHAWEGFRVKGFGTLCGHLNKQLHVSAFVCRARLVLRKCKNAIG